MRWKATTALIERFFVGGVCAKTGGYIYLKKKKKKKTTTHFDPHWNTTFKSQSSPILRNTARNLQLEVIRTQSYKNTWLRRWKKKRKKEFWNPDTHTHTQTHRHTHLEGSFCFFLFGVSSLSFSLLWCSPSLTPLTGIRGGVHLLVFFTLIQVCFTHTGSAPHVIHGTPLSLL